MVELRASLCGHELIHVGVFDIPRSPSLGVTRWAGRAHTLCFPGSLGSEGLPRRAGWRTKHTVADVGQFPAAAAVEEWEPWWHVYHRRCQRNTVHFRLEGDKPGDPVCVQRLCPALVVLLRRKVYQKSGFTHTSAANMVNMISCFAISK